MSDLFEFSARKLARRDDPDTSKAAAARAGSVQSYHHSLILDALASWGPMAPEQIADALRIGSEEEYFDKVAVCRRVNELEKAGKIEVTGELHKNRSGRSARVFRGRDAP